MIDRFLKRIAPAAALAGAALLSGCGGVDIKFGGDDGVPLAELDTSGTPPTEIVLAGPDTIVVSEGETFGITVSGDAEAVEALRFSLEDDGLSVGRENKLRDIKGRATVQVTMPKLEELVLAGSGEIRAARLSDDAEVVVAGSGSVAIDRVDARKLSLTIAGSGDFSGSGKVDSLDLTIAGSGEAAMPGLMVGNADISVAGSGDAEFASDGKIDASIMGSGSIVVNGNADCTVSAMGSGKLKCRKVEANAPAAPEAPTAPEAPAA